MTITSTSALDRRGDLLVADHAGLDAAAWRRSMRLLQCPGDAFAMSAAPGR